MFDPVRRVIAALAVSAVAAAPLGIGSVAMVLGMADAALAKSENGKGGGNGGGNGKGGGNGAGKGGGGKSASASASGRGGKSGPARSGSRKGGKSVAGGAPKRGESYKGGTVRKVVVKKVRTSDGRVKTVRTVYVSKGATAKAPAKATARAATATAPETTVASGKSWKSRLASGALRVHPSELGAWNSAKRSPVAIANMAEKYRETGKATGAGGQIGALVVAYEDYNLAINGDPEAGTLGLSDSLQAAVDAGTITVEMAERILAGDLPTEEEFAGEVAAISDSYELPEGVSLSYEAGSVGCSDGGDGGCDAVMNEAGFADLRDQIAAIEADAAALEDPEILAAIDARVEAEAELKAAQAMVMSATTPGLAAQMLADVEELLHISLQAPEQIIAPAEEDSGLEGGETVPPLGPVGG